MIDSLVYVVDTITYDFPLPIMKVIFLHSNMSQLALMIYAIPPRVITFISTSPLLHFGYGIIVLMASLVPRLVIDLIV